LYVDLANKPETALPQGRQCMQHQGDSGAGATPKLLVTKLLASDPLHSNLPASKPHHSQPLRFYSQWMVTSHKHSYYRARPLSNYQEVVGGVN